MKKKEREIVNDTYASHCHVVLLVLLTMLHIYLLLSPTLSFISLFACCISLEFWGPLILFFS